MRRFCRFDIRIGAKIRISIATAVCTQSCNSFERRLVEAAFVERSAFAQSFMGRPTKASISFGLIKLRHSALVFIGEASCEIAQALHGTGIKGKCLLVRRQVLCGITPNAPSHLAGVFGCLAAIAIPKPTHRKLKHLFCHNLFQ